MSKVQTAEKLIEINLLDIANQLALTAKGLQKRVEETGKPAVISASMLAAKMPELKGLDDLKLFKLNKNSDGFKAYTLCIYKDNDEGDAEAHIYDAEWEPLKQFEVVSFKSGKAGYCTLKHLEKPIVLTASISVGDDHLIKLEDEGVDGLMGEGMPPVDYLRIIPQPETPLHSPVIPHNVELEIVSNGKKSRKYGTPLVCVKLPNDEIVKDVITNAALERIYQKYGNGAKFVVANKRPKRNKNGEPVNAKGIVDSKKPAWIVEIIDCQMPDLSDL